MKIVPLILLLTLSSAVVGAEPNFRASPRIIQESRKAGDGKPAYSINVKYPYWPSGKLPISANQASLKLAHKDIAIFKKFFVEVVPAHALSCSLGEDYEIVYQTSDLAVVLIQGSSFLGGAHPSNIFHRLLVSPHSGSSLEIGACFRAGSPWLKAVADYCRGQLLADKDLLSDPDWIRQGSAPTQANYAVALPTAKGLRVIFPPFQVAAYAAGAPEILVPYSVVKSFIDPQGPLKGIRF